MSAAKWLRSGHRNHGSGISSRPSRHAAAVHPFAAGRRLMANPLARPSSNSMSRPRTVDPIFCLQHAVNYPFSRRPGPQEGCLLAAMTVREPLESRLRAAPGNPVVMDGLRPGWDDPACRDYPIGQLRPAGLAGRQARAPSHGASWARLLEGLPCRRFRARDYGPLMRTMAM